MATTGRVLLAVCCAAVAASGVGVAARRQSPLLPADTGNRGRSRTTECQFGKQLKELGTSWFPDLGPPFGVMFCIRCQCVPVQKKRRVVARVQCRNIKHECPPPSCDEPVLLPGQCCKLCAQDMPTDGPDVVRDVPIPPLPPDEEDRSLKHFAALLTGRTSMVLHREDAVVAPAPGGHQEGAGAGQGLGGAPPPVATARFTFHRKHLYHSFYTSSPVRPRALQFVDHEGRILEEQAIGDSEYGNRTGKVCGVWRRVPREYRRLLREERMLVTLIWPDNVSLSGLVLRYRTLSSELFSALLDAAPTASRHLTAGGGGTAVVSASSSAGPTVHLHLVFNGVFGPHEVRDVPLTVRLEADGDEGGRRNVVLEEVVHVAKPAHELNEVEVASPVSPAALRDLARGRLRVVLENRRRPEALRLEGRVTTRVTCELFQCLLSAADGDEGEGETAVAAPTPTPASGVGLFYVDRDGGLVYNVQLDSLPADPPAAVLKLVSGRGKRRVELKDLTPSLVPGSAPGSGNATGTVDQLSPRELEHLYAGELSLSVAAPETSPGLLLRGKLSVRPVADARTSPAPYLLRRRDPDTPAGVTGLAWVGVDLECTLHYEVSLSGPGWTGTGTGADDEERQLQLYWEELPFLAPFAPVTRRLLEEFEGPSLEGFAMGLTADELARVENSVNYVEVRDRRGSVVLRSPVLKVSVPAACLPHYTDNSVPAAPSDAGGNEIVACYHEDRFHEDGAQWRSRKDACAMCSCQRGRVVCDAMACPPPACPATHRLPPPPGECCPLCAAGPEGGNASASSQPQAGCHLGGQLHRAGSSWYPYLPPHGFDTCAVCACDPRATGVRCQRVQCPALPCDEAAAFKPDRRACCKQCPEPPPPPPPVVPETARDQQDPWMQSDVLAAGGCSYTRPRVVRNGEEWHPRIPPFGEDKCINCVCKDGKVSCTKKSCPRPPCHREDSCCHQCKRNHTRHHKERHFN